jgi:hypothetical protein
MKRHLTHILMCLPMLIVAGVAVAAGANPAFLLIAAMCVLMMAPMMMGGGGHGGDDPKDRS